MGEARSSIAMAAGLINSPSRTPEAGCSRITSIRSSSTAKASPGSALIGGSAATIHTRCASKRFPLILKVTSRGHCFNRQREHSGAGPIEDCSHATTTRLGEKSENLREESSTRLPKTRKAGCWLAQPLVCSSRRNQHRAEFIPPAAESFRASRIRLKRLTISAQSQPFEAPCTSRTSAAELNGWTDRLEHSFGPTI